MDLKKIREADSSFSLNVDEAIFWMFKSANTEDKLGGFFTDVEFSFKDDDKPLFAHQMILATRSPVFADLFFGSGSDENRDGSLRKVVTITDISFWPFAIMLLYIYLDIKEGTPAEYFVSNDENISEEYRSNCEVPFASHWWLESLELARRYRLPEWEEGCVRVLSCYCLNPANIGDDEVLKILKIANCLGRENIQENCFNYIEMHTMSVLLQSEMHAYSQEIVLSILKRPKLALESEALLLHKVIEWILKTNAGAECRNNLLSHIDIMSITVEEFRDVLKTHPSFFTSSESESISVNLVLRGSRDLPEFCKSNKVKRVAGSSDFSSRFVLVNKWDSFDESLVIEDFLINWYYKLTLSGNYPWDALYLEKVEFSFDYYDAMQDPAPLQFPVVCKKFQDIMSRVGRLTWTQRFFKETQKCGYLLTLNESVKLEKGKPIVLLFPIILKEGIFGLPIGGSLINCKGKSTELVENELVSVEMLYTVPYLKFPDGEKRLLISAFHFRSSERILRFRNFSETK